ncbi:MAG: hypothetical protein OQK04_14525 [Kangiellaceae bacterium]|nr:hypothetical protein [Kangiellaceae bacterium]MCW8999921.1 hypothetical protein [Kangiellaceae bacterium]
MKVSQLPKEKKLNVLYRVEPGCLGPDGPERIEDFCQFAEKEVEDLDADFVHWDIVPRFDKTLPEMEYKALQKRLTHEQAAKYLSVFEKDLDEFEEHLHEKLGVLIENYLGRTN